MGLVRPLRSRDSFAQLSKNGRRRQGRWCWVRYAPLPVIEGLPDGAANEPVSQVGYAIGRKVGNAVVRNRIRRRLRPMIEAEAATLPHGFYLIGVKNDRAASISYEDLRNDLLSALAAASGARER